MDRRVARAAANNAHWCDAVCRWHGIPTSTESSLWAAAERSPEYYPDAVTLVPGLRAEKVFAAVQAGPGCSVKDSFADVDLGPHGFVELFEARWMFREAPESAGPQAGWTFIETTSALDAWRAAAGLKTIADAILGEESMKVLAAAGPAGVRAGGIANRTGDVVGVSNVFSGAMSADELWGGVVSMLATAFPGVPLVGYEHGDDLAQALATGFEEIGPLRVWLAPPGETEEASA